MLDFSGISNQRWSGKALRSFLQLIPHGSTMRVVQGELRGMRWITGASTHGCWLGSYELSKQRAIAQSLSRGNVFFDVGANVGFYTLLASKRVGETGRVVSFEPLPSNLDYLQRHIDLNSLDNVTVIESAVSDQSGKGFFAEGPDNCMGKLAEQGGYEVDLVSLDDLIAADRVPTPDVIKIDVEGAELAVLQGAKQLLSESRPKIFLATHGTQVHSDCLSFLNSCGYQCQSLEQQVPVDECDEVLATHQS